MSFDKLETVLGHLDKEDKEIILLGDTNCYFTKKPQGELVSSNVSSLTNVYQLFNMRVTLSSSTIIDHIATTSCKNIAKSGVHKVSLSDHYMIYCVRKFEGGIEKSHKVITTHSMKRFNETDFQNDISSINWKGLVTYSNDVNEQVNNVVNVFSEIINKHALIQNMRVSKKYCPWVNKNMKKLMQTRDKLKKTTVQNNSHILMD